MRFLGIVGLVTMGLGVVSLGGCDDAKSVGVNPDIGWKLGCAAGSTGCVPFKYHSQGEMTELERNFDVSCSLNGDAISFTIKDPGLSASKAPPVGWPPATISVTNGNGASNACNVTVTDAVEEGQAAITMRGTCPGSGGLGGCTLTRSPNAPGYDWVGTLACDKLERDSAPDPQYRLNGLDAVGPIKIALANCD